ncbi:hypothetical protein EII34_00310 [Arachnia propionica]|uniref:Uncharacterized protein n=1 Tax=Arachnia propionica TaxID=1750 RepID=A0A3P1TC20_9ACTN|nr:hypothetical protein [Arachnia propionica]RRD06981.1 hypothetical protein EII34_00310 [Arachnia propionica]
MFIPIAREELGAIDGSVTLRDREAHRVTPELLEALGYTTEQREDAEYAALVLASVAALARHGERLVLVADVAPALVSQGRDLDNGGCVLSEVPQRSLTCWFSEAPGVDWTAAAVAAKGLDIDTAWGFDEVQELLASSDLLWNDVEEYRRGL